MRITRNRGVELLAVAVVLGVLSCPQPMNEAFTEKVVQEIQAAVAPVRALTVAGDGNGVVSPAGVAEVKDGIAFRITATAFSSHVFKRWTKQSGAGTVVFADAALAETTVTVTGGDAAILAEFEARPTVFYTTPTGTGIYTNTKVFIYFSKAMDEASVESAGAITVSIGGTTAVTGTVELISASVARFTPAAYLSPQQYHVVRVAKSVKDTLSATMEADYSGTFRTASTADTEPPTAPSFTVNEAATTHVASRSISLTEITAVDGGEIVEALIQENGGALQSFAFTPTISYELSAGDGAKTLRLYAVDSVGNVSTEYAERVVTLDTVAPSGSFVVKNGADQVADYVNSTSVTLSSAFTDEGTSMTGAQMQYSVDGGSSWSGWEAYNAAKTAPLAAGDGVKTVQLRVKDLVGNTTQLEDAIVLDVTPPSFAAFALNSGAAYATSTSLSAALTATDGTSGVNEMAFSVDGGENYGSWKPFAAADTVTASGQGAASIYAKVRDRAGNEATQSDGIFVDTAAPTVSAFSIASGATYALAATVALGQTASDPNDAAGSGLTGGQAGMRFSNDGGGTWSDWETYSATKASWTLLSGDGAKTVSLQVRDAAGNVGSGSDGITLDTAAPVVTSVRVNGTGDGSHEYINTTSTTLQLSVADAAGTPIEMRFTNIENDWSSSSWIPYAAAPSHTLAGGEGSKTVYCQFRDEADTTNHVSAGNDSIVLDATGPTITLTSPANSATVAGFADCAADASDASAGVWKVEFFGNGTAVGTASAAPYAAAQAWPVHSLTEAGSYGAYAKAYDRAGNSTNSATNTVTIDNWTGSFVTLSSLGTFSGGRASIAANADFTTIYIAYENIESNSVGIARSTNGGTSWTVATTISSASRPAIAVDASGSLHLVHQSWSNQIYYKKSMNGGTSWITQYQLPTSDAHSSYFPCIEVYGTSYVHIFYIDMGSTYVRHFASSSGGGGFSSQMSINGSGISWIDTACTGAGLHLVHRDSTGILSHTRMSPQSGSIISGPRSIADIEVSSCPSITSRTEGSQIAVIGFGDPSGNLVSLSSPDEGGIWTKNDVKAGRPNARTATVATLNQLSEPLYYMAYNDYNAGQLSVAKSSDAITWYSYNVIAVSGGNFVPTAVCDGQYLYAAYHDNTAKYVKFAKVKVNY